MIDCLKLKKSNCKNCYKCIRHCPVKSIRISGNQAHIIGDECILCGGCFVVCPQNAKEIVSELDNVKNLILTGQPVYASLAPSFVANYPGIGIGGLKQALLKLGFTGVEETAIGATIVKREYERILTEEQPSVLISSCCHAVNLLIQKHYPQLLPYLAPVLSPMLAHGCDLKKRFPKAKTVFIGPCVAKKDEAQRYPGLIDAVLTFEELNSWLTEKKVKVEPKWDTTEKSRARFFPIQGGIIKTMNNKPSGYNYLAIDGVENCLAALEDLTNQKIDHCFLEMSSCQGSCIGGPIMEKKHFSPVANFLAVQAYAGPLDFNVADLNSRERFKNIEDLRITETQPTESEIQAILIKMGKHKPEDELNCGSCGYNTCRKKAVAIYHGKADYSMCLPFLKEKAENFSDNIIHNTPNCIVVLNENYEIQQINKAAKKMMGIKQNSDVLGGPISRILDEKPFRRVKETGHVIRDQKTYLTEYNCFVEQSIIYDKEYHLIICLMRDITESEAQKTKKTAIQNETVAIADKVVEKQMRIVQEIASLLGETAADTKIALTKLKETIKNE
jgi:iron only hydrogenase large subunit-like protein/uncharacterized Fe-S cluster-containing protein